MTKEDLIKAWADTYQPFLREQLYSKLPDIWAVRRILESTAKSALTDCGSLRREDIETNRDHFWTIAKNQATNFIESDEFDEFAESALAKTNIDQEATIWTAALRDLEKGDKRKILLRVLEEDSEIPEVDRQLKERLSNSILNVFRRPDVSESKNRGNVSQSQDTQPEKKA